MSASIASLAEGTRQRAEAWLENLRASGIPHRVTSTRRSRREQQRLFDRFLRGESNLPAAEPGTSDHEIGRAIDVVFESEEDLEDGVALAQESGFQWAGAADPVHFVDLLEAPTLAEVQESEGFPAFEETSVGKAFSRAGSIGKAILAGLTGIEFGSDESNGCCG